jgi:hypothetical protein
VLDNGVEVPQPGPRTAPVGDEDPAGQGLAAVPRFSRADGLRADLDVSDFELDAGAMAGIARPNTGRRVGDQDPATHEEH